MDDDAVRERAGDLPRDPGVYQFLDGDAVLYVGKAVDLRDRVRSYVDPRSERIRRMVARAEDIETAVTDTESQALLLEANLIKRHQPRYNVRLKDDKSYPLVALSAHPFPRIQITRSPEDGATAFGPFTDKGLLETVVKAVRSVYGLRGCSDHKYANRDRPCLDYDIGICSAPCTDEIDRESYLGDVAAVERFFRGETGILADPLRREMEAAAQSQEYERAANCRDMLDAVERLHESGDAAVHDAEGERRRTDVLGVSLAETPTVAVLHAEGGQLLDRERHTLDAPDNTNDPGQVLGAFIPQYYADRERPDVLLCSDRPAGETLETWLETVGVDLRVPGTGREATLVDLALKNASRATPADDPTGALAAELGLETADRIEGFDVSHAQGRATVGSNVCFVDGDPDKSGYRRKRLPDRNDDYESMRELIRWRAERALEGRDDRPAPDLLLIDGGEGQREAATDALSAVGWDVPAVALAKAEERVIAADGVHDWPSDATHLHLLQRVRDEAHRFARTYHETVRDDVSTPLDSIPGVGPETRKRLLGRFGSVSGVRNASREELRLVPGVGEQTAERIDTQLS
jgi:excinuclease ABC subunit C